MDAVVVMSLLGAGLGYIGIKKMIKKVILKNTLKDMIYKNRIKINQKNIKIYNLDERICCICLDDFHVKCENHRKCCKKGYQLHCNHFFHKKCISEWLKTKAKCPLCNFNVKNKYSEELLKYSGVLHYDYNLHIQ